MGCLTIQEENLLLHPWGVSPLQEPEERKEYHVFDRNRSVRNLLVAEPPG